MELESYYREVISEHSRSPLHAGLREPFDAQVFRIHPAGEEDVVMRVTLCDAGDEPVLADVSYQAAACAISLASISVMSDLIIGRTVGEAMDIAKAFHEMILPRGNADPDEDLLGDAVAFTILSRHPSRLRCALLGWMAWKEVTALALSQYGER